MNDVPPNPPSDANGFQRVSAGNDQQADAQLEVQKLLRATLDSSLDMIQVFQAVRNPQGDIIDFTWLLNNHAAGKIYGDVVGQSLLLRQPGVVEEGIFAAFKQVVETGLPQQYEKQYQHEQFNGWFHQSVVKLNDGVATTTADITARKRAEEELRQSKAFLQSVIDSSLDVIQVFQAVPDKNGLIADFTWVLNNRQAVEQNGDVIGKSLLSLQPGVLETGIFDRMVAVAQSGQPFQGEQYYAHEQFSGWFYQALVKTDEGVAMTTRDITPQKQAQQELVQSKDLLQTVFDVSLNPIAYHKALRDEQGTLVDFEFQLRNKVARQYAVEDGTGERYSAAYPELMDTVVFQMYSEVVETGKALNTEVQVKLKGEDHWFHLLVVKLGDGLVATAIDVTEGRRSEQEILRLNEEIAQKATDKYQQIFNTIDESFCVLELLYDKGGNPVDYRFAEVNPAFERQTGLSNVTGKTFRSVLTTEPQWLEIYDQVVKTGEPASFEAYHPGTGRWHQVRASRIASSQALAITFTDITQRKRRDQDQAFRLKFSDSLRTESMADALAYRALQGVSEYLQLDRCYLAVYQMAEDSAVITHQVGNHRVRPMPAAIRLSDFPHALQVTFAGTLVINNVTEEAGLSPTDQQNIDALGLRALVAATVRQGENHPHWVLVAVSASPRQWTQSEISLLEEVAERTWAALERAKTEEALRASQKRFESIANLVPDLLWDSMPGGATNWYNQRWLAYTGQSFDQAIGWGWTQAIHPDDRDASAKRYQEALAAGQSLRQEHRIRRHDGAYRWFVISTSPVKDESGQVVRMYGAATDIHESKLAEEALQVSERFVQGVIRSLPLVIYLFDLVERRNRYLSPQMAPLFGYTVEQMQTANGDLIATFFHPDDRPRLAAHFERIRLSQPDTPGHADVFVIEYRVKHRQRGWVWVQSRDTVYARDEQGRPTLVLGAAEDISARKADAQALQESEKRLRLAIEATEMATWEWNLDTNQVYWNEQHFRLFGMQPHPNPLSPDAFMRHVHPKEQARINALLERTIAERGIYDTEFCAVREDGSQRWMSGYGRITEERNGQPIRLSGVMFDVDERRRAEDALREADRRKDEFLAMLAHELRNPMSTLRSGLQLLALTTGDDETSRSTVAMMTRQTDHLVRMVDDLLDVSRISQDKIELKSERVNLVELVSQAADSVRTLYQAQGKRLHMELPQAPVYLQGDATRLTQVVANLLTNGARYTGEQGQVWLSLRPTDNEVILQVSDNGIGLAKDQLKAIFELFVQMDNSTARSKGGLGLGLTLVKRLVEMHGGRVGAQSAGLGKGSLFTVHLPTGPTTEPQAPPIHPVTTSTTLSRLLIIDDNADAGLLLTMLLKLKGYDVHSRTSGRAGLEAGEQLQPAAILLDIGMPELDGYATCKLIREQAWGQDVVVIALTGYGQEEDRQRTREAGFDGHLVKPVDVSELTHLLTDLLPKGQNRAGLP